MKNLKIAAEILFPLDAVTQTLAAIGRKGAGKTYLATMIAEQMLDASAQVVAIDPVGNWWGLRVGADGKTRGKEIFVIGGEHGDVPIVPEAGARIARLLVEKTASAVLDVSGFRLGERKRFCADFGEELLHLKKKTRTPMHIFIEEAQLIIPQRVGPEEARMVGAFEQIVRLGRNYGIGCTLVTQRPQSVNKEVLSQVECLCVLQVTGPHERKALEDWVQEVGADRKLVGELPSLAQGEGYVWSPSWLRIYERVHFSKKQTFDASATPVVGKETKAASLSAVDVNALRADMAEVVAQVEKDDPRKLHKRIMELEKELLLEKQSKPKAEKVDIKKIEVPVIGKRAIAGIEKAAKKFNNALPRVAALLSEWKDEVVKVQSAIDGLVSKMEKINTPAKIMTVREVHEATEKSMRMKTRSGEENEIKKEIKLPDDFGSMVGELNITRPEQRVLDALAWYESISDQNPSNEIVAFLAGYSHCRSTGYTNPRGYLKTKGLIDYQSGTVCLTPAGRSLAATQTKLLTNDELHRIVLERLDGPERRVLKPLLERYPGGISNTELCSLSGYSHERSTGYTNPRGRLKSFGLIEYENGEVKARSILFL